MPVLRNILFCFFCTASAFFSCHVENQESAVCEAVIQLESIKPGSYSESWLPIAGRRISYLTSDGSVAFIRFDEPLQRIYSHSVEDQIVCTTDSLGWQLVNYDVYYLELKAQVESFILEGEFYFRLRVSKDRSKPLEDRRLETLEIILSKKNGDQKITVYPLISIPLVHKNYPLQVESPEILDEIHTPHKSYSHVYHALIADSDSLEIFYNKAFKLIGFRNQRGSCWLL
ncbi:MAG: hypothetical protein IPM48_07640 [Saprospiraceae bacterium]|nr:hypothetical protein [Saprospiraceae bacterium]